VTEPEGTNGAILGEKWNEAVGLNSNSLACALNFEVEEVTDAVGLALSEVQALLLLDM
jgi:hypothetical protein